MSMYFCIDLNKYLQRLERCNQQLQCNQYYQSWKELRKLDKYFFHQPQPIFSFLYKNLSSIQIHQHSRIQYNLLLKYMYLIIHLRFYLSPNSSSIIQTINTLWIKDRRNKKQSYLFLQYQLQHLSYNRLRKDFFFRSIAEDQYMLDFLLLGIVLSKQQL